MPVAILGYPFERELAGAGVARWVDLVWVRLVFISWLGSWTDFLKRYGLEAQRRPVWAKRVRAAHGRLMQRVRADPNAEAWRRAYMTAFTQDAGGEQELQEGGGRASQLLTMEGFPLEVEAVERQLRGLRDGWLLHSIVDVRETDRRASGHTHTNTGCAGRASRMTSGRSLGNGAPISSPTDTAGRRCKGRSAHDGGNDDGGGAVPRRHAARRQAPVHPASRRAGRDACGGGRGGVGRNAARLGGRLGEEHGGAPQGVRGAEGARRE
eukprot:5599857-Prymnesium_polylepis.1